MVRQVKAAQTAAVACHDGEQCHAFEAVRENIGRHLRDGQQGDDQHDAHHAQAGHNGQCDEGHHQIFHHGDRKTLRTGKFSVESNGNERTEKECESSRGDECQCA